MWQAMHIDAGWIGTLRDIFQAHGVPLAAVFVFGSRVHGRNVKAFSDLDLCIRGDEPLPADTLLQLSIAFADSDLPIKVDVIDWATTKPAFRDAIAGDLTPLFEQAPR